MISAHTKKKELVGNYVNGGRQWRASKTPVKVSGHDFPGPDVPRAYPYGIYDLGRNTGFVDVGTDHDTAAFAVASVRGWWRAEGRRLYKGAKGLLITADGGGSNGYKPRQWKVEHRLFSFIASNWRGEPLRDYETIVNLIAGTTTAKGLPVTCRPNALHGEWNYKIPRNREGG